MPYVIIEYATRSVDGDERSRTHPGHGYPAHTEESCEYREYANEDVWAEEVKTLHLRNAKYTAGFLTKAEVAMRVTINDKVVGG
jgi:hypothetical protein